MWIHFSHCHSLSFFYPLSSDLSSVFEYWVAFGSNHNQHSLAYFSTRLKCCTMGETASVWKKTVVILRCPFLSQFIRKINIYELNNYGDGANWWIKGRLWRRWLAMVRWCNTVVWLLAYRFIFAAKVLYLFTHITSVMRMVYQRE